MPNANYVITTEGSFLGESELYHHGVPGMKWGRRKAVVKSGSIGTNRNNANRSKNSVAKAKKRTNNGKKKASKVIYNVGSKTVKAVSKTAKIGMSFAQSMWNISDEARNAREMSSYLNTASSMSPEYRKRFMYD